MLNLEEYQFTQRADNVGLTTQGATLDLQLNLTLTADPMAQLEALIGAEKLRERYKLEHVVERPTFASAKETDDEKNSPLSILNIAVSNETRGKILKRAKLNQSKHHLSKRLWWAAVDE
ncbi:MAG: hypothetical protein M1812_005782 [Candelaria pacifica]|nr:MAG: hypothetical protein M1812_005782 [Candelaria pacifica]